jgi:hypothetical protein
MKVQFDFELTEKIAMLEVLGKYTDVAPHHQEVVESLKLAGSTVLFPDEARYLAGIVRPYYSFLADRLENHPGVMSEDQRLRASGAPELPGLE